MNFLLFVVTVMVVVIGVSILLRDSRARRALAGRPKQESPREILMRRYAAGEIDEDEYLRRMSGLSQSW
ncbi:hypothetical protein [Rhizohabitans arisaemae]|uniref:hypothetical protein n=1 Tax=Rhizohabitans arisaemae TaxID=2720610 RepID=UPI0024B1D5B7|nr:hypothetical protein [Rhizohabitans arisaemae]